ncbi:glycosyltransferase family 87 protein [Nocardioides ultimimeridianus]
MSSPPAGVFTRQRLIIYPSVVLALSLVVWLASIALGHPPAVAGGGPVLPDFLAYWTGGHVVATGQSGHLYDPAVQSSVQQAAVPTMHTFAWFVAPPFVAYAYAVLGTLPYGVACVIVVALSIGALVLSARLMLPLLRANPTLPRRLLLLGAAAAPPVFESIGSGQNSPFVLLLWVVALRSLLVGRDATAGGLLALAAFKPHLLLFVPVLLVLRRRWWALAGFSAVLAALGASCLAAGATTTAWLRTLGGHSFGEAVEKAQSWKMESLSSFATTVTGVARLDVLLLAIGVAALVVWTRRTEQDPFSDIAVLAAVTVTFAPHVMLYDAVLLLIPVFWIAAAGRLHELRWVLLTIGLLQFLTAPRYLAGRGVEALHWLAWPWPAIPIAALTLLMIRGRGAFPDPAAPLGLAP